MNDTPTFYAKNRALWRAWLKKNHDSARLIWLVYYKKHTDKPSVSYNDAVEEAICFGWIDSTVRKLDDERYMQKFTPRSDKSSWSASNIERAERMIRDGTMTDAGLVKYRLARVVAPSGSPVPVADPDVMPPAMEKALLKLPGSLEKFRELPPSHRRRYIAWIIDAKKEVTRVRRADKLAVALKNNITLMP